MAMTQLSREAFRVFVLCEVDNCTICQYTLYYNEYNFFAGSRQYLCIFSLFFLMDDDRSRTMTEYIQKLRNKVLYKLHRMVYDADAEEYAKQRNTAESSGATIQNPTRWMSRVEGLTLKNAFSGLKGRFAKDASGVDLSGVDLSGVDLSGVDMDIGTGTDGSGNIQPSISAQSIGSQVVYYLKQSIYFVFCLIFCMLVANQLITTPWPVRLFGFIATAIVLLVNPLLMIGFFAYYIGRMIYAIYNNTKTKDISSTKKQTLLPTVFALLPITTRRAESILGSIFLYPFTYPKSERSAQRLPIISGKYLESLDGSIVGLENLKKQFSEIQGMFTAFATHLMEMHEVHVTSAMAPGSTANTANTASTASKNINTQ